MKCYFLFSIQIPLHLLTHWESAAHLHIISHCIYLWCIATLTVTQQVLFSCFFPLSSPHPWLWWVFTHNADVYYRHYALHEYAWQAYIISPDIHQNMLWCVKAGVSRLKEAKGKKKCFNWSGIVLTLPPISLWTLSPPPFQHTSIYLRISLYPFFFKSDNATHLSCHWHHCKSKPGED